MDEDLNPLREKFFSDFQERLQHVEYLRCPPAKALSTKALDLITRNFSSLLRASANADRRNEEAGKDPLLASEHRHAWDRLLFDFFKRDGDDIEAIT